MAKLHRFQVVLAKDDDGNYFAEVPGLDGCCAEGYSQEEALDNLRQAIEMYLEELHEAGAGFVPTGATVVEIRTMDVEIEGPGGGGASSNGGRGPTG